MAGSSPYVSTDMRGHNKVHEESHNVDHNVKSVPEERGKLMLLLQVVMALKQALKAGELVRLFGS